MSKLPFYSIERLMRAAGYALSGLASAFRTEAAFRLELIAFAVLAPLALLSDMTAVEKALLVSSLFLVLMAELVNTAIETLVERISPEIHPLSKRAKDIGSAVVLVSLANAAFVWIMLYLP